MIKVIIMLNQSFHEDLIVDLKLLLIGDSEVGKTCLMTKYTDKYFVDSHITTIGIEKKEKRINLQGLNIRLQIWDTAGQERFKSLTKNYFRNVNGILFVYDITSKKSFDSAKMWIKEADKITCGFAKILVGNKTDLEEFRQVRKEDVESYSTENNIFAIETSAKNNVNIDEAFECIVTKILEGKNNREIYELYCHKKITRIQKLEEDNGR